MGFPVSVGEQKMFEPEETVMVLLLEGPRDHEWWEMRCRGTHAWGNTVIADAVGPERRQ